MQEPHHSLEQEMPFLSHLIELRDRLLRAMVTILIVFLVLFPFSEQLFSLVSAPLVAALPEGSTMIATHVTSPFMAPLKLVFVLSIYLAMPILLYHIWSFIAPALYQHEKRLIVPLMVSSTLLFYAGMVFVYYMVFPIVFGFFASVTPAGVEMSTDISYYLDFALKMFFAFGFAFEVPVLTFLLIWANITTADALVEKRPYVFVGSFIIGMLLTPPDVLSQLLLAIPMWLLFEAGIIASRYLLPKTVPSADETTDYPDDYEPLTEAQMQAEMDKDN